MQIMLTAFGRVLHLSIGLDRTDTDPQLVCISQGDYELAADDEDAERSFGFGKQ